MSVRAGFTSRPLGALWYGTELPALEEMCLRSMVDTGWDITLFSYNPISGVPGGVKTADAREVEAEDRTNPAMFGDLALDVGKASDIWRLKMIRDLGLTWVDPDFLALAPFGANGARHVFVRTRMQRFANGILYFERNDPLLHEYIRLAEEEYPVRYYWSLDLIRKARAAKKAGAPIHMAHLPTSGITGPKVFSHLVWKYMRPLRAQPMSMFVPFSWKERDIVFRPSAEVERRLTRHTCAVHLWGSGLRGRLQAGDYPADSFIADQMRRVGMETSPSVASRSRDAVANPGRLRTPATGNGAVM